VVAGVGHFSACDRIHRFTVLHIVIYKTQSRFSVCNVGVQGNNCAVGNAYCYFQLAGETVDPHQTHRVVKKPGF
jgi:hypothetical protein